jgi:protein-S-isoprenylcysteine O-methyltransferase Ste14
MILSALLAWGLSQRELSYFDQLLLDIENLIWPLVFFIAGTLLALAGVKEFHQQQTTVNPLKPKQASALVTSGIFQFTRNPMYLGMLIVLLGWADLLDNLLAFSGAGFFYLYISIFQIKPEEVVMTQKFGEEYLEYSRQVRRWL